MSLETFTSAYIDCALWTSTADGAPEAAGNDSWDTSFSSYGCDATDLAPEAMSAIMADCADFYKAYSALWDDDAQAGHDFWLTRNRHGAGFWDRGYPQEIADALADGARAYGERYLHLGDDGLIYIS